MLKLKAKANIFLKPIIKTFKKLYSWIYEIVEIQIYNN